MSESTFSKACSGRKKTIRVSSCASNHVSKRRYNPWLHGMRGVRGAGWGEHASLWSEALVAIQTQINRGGTLELMIEEGGGGVSEGGLSALEPRSPEKWRTGAHYAHFQTQLRTGPPRRCSLSSQTPLPLSTTFHTCNISADARDTRAVCMATWKVSRTWSLENFELRFTGARRL